MSADPQLPLFSIVVPSFNQGRFLDRALESIFHQRYPRLEVVVMDGGSSDDSVQIIERYATRLLHWQSRADGGQAAAINAGVQHCHGDLVAWLNSDDWYCDGALWTIARAWIAHPGRGLYIGNGLRYDQATQRLTPFCARHIAINRAALVEGVDYILQPATFFCRRAWNEVGGLDPQLVYSLDWDLLVRMARGHAAVAINEFLGVSREYGDTKTSRGSLERVHELARVVARHSGRGVTEGTLYYRIGTLLPLVDEGTEPGERARLRAAFAAVGDGLARLCGNRDGFPERSDPQDTTYLPLVARSDGSRRPPSEVTPLPSISVVTPSMNQAQFLPRTLDSVLDQEYPGLELIVCDGGSTDGSVPILKRYANRLAHWESEPDRGPAHAINKGFARAHGEIVSWLSSDDMLTTDALWEVGAAFAADPELDLVYANALYIDENDALTLADHGFHRTGLYRGEMQPHDRVAQYWSYIHAVPQPTVFFRRRLLERCGMLDESYQFIFDFELFWRFSQRAKVRKLERTLAFYRLHTQAKSSNWNRFLVELYRCSRPSWPPLISPAFVETLRGFLFRYMQLRYGERPRDLWFWSVAALVGLSAVSRIGNPEAWHLPLPQRRGSRASQRVASLGELDDSVSCIIPAALPGQRAMPQSSPRYRSVFHSYLWPRTPGLSGGEIRDFHLLRRLLHLGEVEFFSAMPIEPDAREDPLAGLVTARHHPATLPGEYSTPHGMLSALQRLASMSVGPYHAEIAQKRDLVVNSGRPQLSTALARPPDFLVVSPQTNPLALTGIALAPRTRAILATYDVEAVRMQRIAASYRGAAHIAARIDAQRAVRFERDNLRRYDGVIAVSEVDKRIFVNKYGLSSERVLVIENGVDLDYFDFRDRGPADGVSIVFVGSLSYRPNEDAACRLVDEIMPRLWRIQPTARLVVVGHGASIPLRQRADGTRVVVTGRVDDVRPWLARASVACIPLRVGSGTKYKVLEAMSAGVPIVCSSVAREGLDLEHGTHCLVADTDDAIATAITTLTTNPTLAMQMAHQARRRVELTYGWNTTLAPLADWLASIAAFPSRRA